MARKVLIVEDDSNIAELLHLYLEKEGFETAVAGDGGKGVELFRSFHPELVLLDIMLPVMDGWSVLKKIRENDKTPVIMLTAKGETQDKVAGLEGGADDYIVKPFEMKEVLARIHAVLRRFGGEEEGSGEKKLTFDSWSSTWTPMSCWWTASGWIRRPRSWSCSTTWRPPPTGYSPETNCWTRCGASTTSATPVPWTCISSACGRSWRASASSGASKPCGVWVTSSRW